MSQFILTQNLKDTVQLYLTAKAIEETIKPVVNNYQNEIIAINDFKNRYDGKPVETCKDAWKMEDAHFDIYNAACKEGAKNAGLIVENPEHCPLLVAQDNVRKAKQLILEEVDTFDLGGEGFKISECFKPGAREKALELTLKFVVPQLEIAA